jgi:hypothetical protein
MPFNNEFVGMPKAWHSDTQSAVLAATPAPEPDMQSEAVLAAAPPALPQVAEVAVAARTEAVKTETVHSPKKVKRVAHKQQQPRPEGDWRTYALRNGNDNGGFFGGNFGRF